MGIFLVIVIMMGGLPAFDFMVFQDMKECLETKLKVEAKLQETGIEKSLKYLACVSDPGEQAKANR